jgi:hypothetical protein
MHATMQHATGTMGGAVDTRPPVVMMTMITMMTKNLALLKVIITAMDMRPPVVMMTMITMMTKNLALLKVIITARTVQLEDIQLSPAALVHRTT